MAYTAEELKEIKIKETLDFHGITKWHEMNYKGQGINYLELENSGHGENVNDTYDNIDVFGEPFLHGYRTRCSGDVCLFFEVLVDYGNGYAEYIDLAKFVKENNIHIIGLSTSGSMAKPAEEYLKALNVILVASAGNNSTEGVTATLENVAINVGAIKLIDGEIKLEHYSAQGEDTLHFTTLHQWLPGTSFAQPTLSGMIALIMSRYGIMSQDKMIEVLKSICIDAGELGYDTKFGWGVPVLPEKIEMLEETMEGRYTVLYSHLDKITAVEGQTVNAKLPWKAASNIGIMGNTGKSTGPHVHICVIEGIRKSLWHLADMSTSIVPSKKQLDYFVDETLFDYQHVITTGWLGYENHYAYDVVPEDRHRTKEHFEIKWNRRFAGRVLKTGFDSAYGNYVLVGFDTLQF